MKCITPWPVEPVPGLLPTDGAAGALEPEAVPMFEGTTGIGGGGGRGREGSIATNY